jgi:hypothetical protein
MTNDTTDKMVDPAGWKNLASTLRALHRALMENARLDYERERSVKLNPTELLRLLTTDAYFNWLRGLSELMVEIDIIQDAGAAVMTEMQTAVRQAVEHFVVAPAPATTDPDTGYLTVPASADAFAQHYWACVRNDPHVAMAHAGVKQALTAWPQPSPSDAASRLHARHQLTEKARHHSRKK